MANFNRIASFYDFLKQIIFKNQLDTASSYFMDEMPPNAHILIIGGGSGHLLSLLKQDQKVSYVDHSQRMIAMAKKRACNAEVQFFTSDIIDFQPNQPFDVVITPFLLDCFSEKQLTLVFTHINQMLKKGGLWLHSDFYPQNKKQQLLVQFMYLAFRLSASLKVKKLPDFSKFFQKEIFFEEKKVVFRNAMVHSYLYQKIASQ